MSVLQVIRINKQMVGSVCVHDEERTQSMYVQGSVARYCQFRHIPPALRAALYTRPELEEPVNENNTLKLSLFNHNTIVFISESLQYTDMTVQFTCLQTSPPLLLLLLLHTQHYLLSSSYRFSFYYFFPQHSGHPHQPFYTQFLHSSSLHYRIQTSFFN